MALSNALFFVGVFVCLLLLRQSYGQSEYENSTLDGNSTATTLLPELNTDFSPSSNETQDDSTTAANTTTSFATGATTEGPLSVDTTDSTTTDYITINAFDSSSPPVNYSTSGSLLPSGSDWTRGFDLASFFGGIILAVGLLGLVFLVYKVCKLKRSGYSNLA